jgi:hypothetical protein|uniref:Uncharacterized protein n=1 Tax=Myoviridae sp. ct3wi9 TaxID=2826610 RepID=A0A8S5MWL7_9CAUD|nr:MAG TPA: hypothetical protein [Myoviridae sp. ct3wi9]
MAISIFTNRDCQIIQLGKGDTVKLGNNTLIVAEGIKYLLTVGYNVRIIIDDHKDIVGISKIDKNSETATYSIESEPDPEVWGTLMDHHLSLITGSVHYTYRSDIMDRILSTYAKGEFPTLRGFLSGMIAGILVTILIYSLTH